MKLTWKLFVIIVSVISITIVNMNFAGGHPSSSSRKLRRRNSVNENLLDDRFSSGTPRPHRSHRRETPTLTIEDPDSRNRYKLIFFPFNPFNEGDFAYECFRQIRLFCDTTIDLVASVHCAKNGILFYKDKLTNLIDAVHKYFRTFPLVAESIDLPKIYCHKKGRKCQGNKEDINESTSSEKWESCMSKEGDGSEEGSTNSEKWESCMSREGDGNEEYINESTSSEKWESCMSSEGEGKGKEEEEYLNEPTNNKKWMSCMNELSAYEALVVYPKKITKWTLDSTLKTSQHKIAMHALLIRSTLGMDPKSYEYGYLKHISNEVSSRDDRDSHEPHIFCQHLQDHYIINTWHRPR